MSHEMAKQSIIMGNLIVSKQNDQSQTLWLNPRPLLSLSFCETPNAPSPATNPTSVQTGATRDGTGP